MSRNHLVYVGFELILEKLKRIEKLRCLIIGRGKQVKMCQNIFEVQMVLFWFLLVF